MTYTALLIVLFLVLTSLALFIFLRRQLSSSKDRDIELIVNKVKESFKDLSFEALSRNTTEFFKMAGEVLSKHTQTGEKDLDAKKGLIDQTLQTIKEELKSVKTLVSELEKDRENKFGELSNQLKLAAEHTGKLHETTNQLRNALVSTGPRGQWGQKMAEDILRLAGFIEGINYQKEKTQDLSGTRPDYTFFLPHGLKVNMDVKFPMSNYWRYLEAQNDTEKQRFKDQFLRDTRMRIKEVTTRDYINPADNTLDYVIVFIPNEQVYGFINESDHTMLEDAMKSRVIVCSPLTLYAILAVIRQAVDNFNLEKTASRILSLLATFSKQWDVFIKSFDKLGRKIQEAQDEFNTLTSTRRNQLERQIKKIEDIRRREVMDSEHADVDSDIVPAEEIPAGRDNEQ